MSNILEYTLLLQDKISKTLSSIGANSDAASSKFTGLRDKTNQASASMDKLAMSEKGVGRAAESSLSGIRSFMGALGLTAGLYQVGELFTQGIEKAHLLHGAEAQLANTMQNMGVYSQEAFESAINGSAKLASHIKFSKGEVISLQSQLRLVGNIGEDEMNRMIAASADMATKFGMQLPEAGNAIAKAINNPEMMRRLAMQLKIDPDTVKHIQDLAKHGQEAAARLELIGVVEHKVGGAALAAFNADPTARFSKAMDKIKLNLGEIGISFQRTIMPAVEWFADNFTGAFESVKTVISIVSALVSKLYHIIADNSGVKKVVDLFRHWWDLFNEGNPIIVGITAVLGTMLAMTILHATWSGIAAVAVWGWNAAQAAFNTTMWANPITWIIAAIIALIAAISYVIYKTDGWGALWSNLMSFFHNSWMFFKESFIVAWLIVQDKFMTGIELIERGWYRVKALWDKEGADAGLAKLNNEASKRAEELATAKNKLGEYNALGVAALQNASGSLHWNSQRGLGDIVTGLKDKLGINGNKIEPSKTPGTNPTGKEGLNTGSGSPVEAIATGGTRNTTVNINFRNMVENIVFDGGMKESRGDLEKQVTEIFMRVLGMAQSTS